MNGMVSGALRLVDVVVIHSERRDAEEGAEEGGAREDDD